MALKTQEITEAIGMLAKAINKLEAKIDLSVAIPSARTPLITTTDNSTAEPPLPPPPQEVTMPFPTEWRDIIDAVLNRKFRADVQYFDSAKFQLTVHVPKEYSNATPAQLQLNGGDRRVKVMPNHLGSAGVRDYITLVAANLGEETMRKVNEERVQASTM